MTYEGNLSKMKTLLADPVQYKLVLGEESINVNSLIGKQVAVRYQGYINCRICGRKLKKAFGEGFCYPHFMNAPENSPCIIRPELCEAHIGQGRDPQWEEKHHNQPHIVYLAISSGIKVGVTRKDQVPTRWIDQGAWKAVLFTEVPYRRIAGEIEVSLKDHISDKTQWQRMLKNQLAADMDILKRKQELSVHVSEDYQKYISDNDQVWEISYPVTEYPTKVKSINLDKVPEFSGELKGVKGQYLIFDEGRVMNIRKHTGYKVEIEYA